MAGYSEIAPLVNVNKFPTNLDVNKMPTNLDGVFSQKKTAGLLYL